MFLWVETVDFCPFEEVSSMWDQVQGLLGRFVVSVEGATGWTTGRPRPHTVSTRYP